MINTTKADLVFIQSGEELHASIVAALRDASRWMLEAYELQSLDLSTVTTKNHLEAALPAHIERFILRDGSGCFDEQYVNVNGQAGYFSRYLHSYGRTGEPCDRCGTSIARARFGNRHSHFCPTCPPIEKPRSPPPDGC
mgnify:CR=1 FL=1